MPDQQVCPGRRRSGATVLLAGLLLAGVVVPGRAAAWADEGHRVICEIAWQRLAGAGRALVGELLGDGAHDVGPELGRRFVDSCTWADEVHETTHRSTAEYHYLNVRRGAPSVDLGRDCPAYDCVPIAIRRYLSYLVRGETPADGRHRQAEALKFLAHFVGDVHQPLHAGYLDDKGGNEILVRWPGAGADVNLHAVWDYWIVRRAGLAGSRATAELAAGIGAEDAARWQDSDVEGWTDESYRLAVEEAYDLPAGRELGGAYYERALPVVRRQLRKAAVRLAYLLNAIADGSLDLKR
ncbi:MAG TPA: S1/P1 nuclease [Thermoanaerobaculia bacterium]|jgi:hypothetical protein